MMHDFLRATESQGIPITDDLQDLTTAHGSEVAIIYLMIVGQEIHAGIG